MGIVFSSIHKNVGPYYSLKSACFHLKESHPPKRIVESLQVLSMNRLGDANPVVQLVDGSPLPSVEGEGNEDDTPRQLAKLVDVATATMQLLHCNMTLISLGITGCLFHHHSGAPLVKARPNASS